MKRLIIISTLFIFFWFWQPLNAWAWNSSGHMVTGAIAYKELEQKNPIALQRVIVLLKENPEAERLWQPQLSQVEEAQRSQLLFMLAARWSDDIRRDNRYDHPQWHYINLPYKPATELDSVMTSEPDPENILTAFDPNFDVLTSDADDSSKATAKRSLRDRSWLDFSLNWRRASTTSYYYSVYRKISQWRSRWDEILH
ncbi:hypothetical protein STA3757_35150 [Stanieria sp. NIES-3757]|nr:hypothetical protein STA3757_35150 [Stanieria sp. NIES-3757]